MLFTDCKVGDICVCFDEYKHDYEEHKVRVDSIEYEDDYATSTNDFGMVCYVTDLDYVDDEDNAIGVMHEGNFVNIITDNVEVTLNIRTDGTDVYVNGDLYTFDGDNSTKENRIARAVARYYGIILD